MATLARPADFHENLAKIVVFYFYNALTYVMSYKGLNPAGGDALDTLLPDLFVGGRAPGSFDQQSGPRGA